MKHRGWEIHDKTNHDSMPGGSWWVGTKRIGGVVSRVSASSAMTRARCRTETPAVMTERAEQLARERWFDAWIAANAAEVDHDGLYDPHGEHADWDRSLIARRVPFDGLAQSPMTAFMMDCAPLPLPNDRMRLTEVPTLLRAPADFALPSNWHLDGVPAPATLRWFATGGCVL